MGDAKKGRRRYDSPIRRQRTAETRERIVSAGAKLLHGFPIWNWAALTIPNVAERAGVNERTVYRHFANEQALRDAVMNRVEEDVGIDLDDIRLDDLQLIISRIFGYISSEHPFEQRMPLDDTTDAAYARQREALLTAIAPDTARWTESERKIAAAMLDVMWNYASYEHLVARWRLGPAETIAGVQWVIGLVQAAIREDRRPETNDEDA